MGIGGKQMKIEINSNLCKGCEFCIAFCPKKVLKMQSERGPKGYFIPCLTDNDGCTSCGICATMCPDGAIEVFKEVETDG